MKGEFGEMVDETPRDRNGTFESKILRKRQTRFDSFDDKIMSVFARGMTTRDIQPHPEQMYGVEVSAALISEVTDAVTDEVKVWQSRPLDALNLILYLDALYVKMRREGRIENRAVYVAIGVDPGGRKDVLACVHNPSADCCDVNGPFRRDVNKLERSDATFAIMPELMSLFTSVNGFDVFSRDAGVRQGNGG